VSQKAYEMLLQANKFFEDGSKHEAMDAYRDVLRSEPTPIQRQIAETQLRELGGLPHTFSASAKVIHRYQAPGKESRGKSKRKKNGKSKRQQQNGTKAKKQEVQVLSKASKSPASSFQGGKRPNLPSHTSVAVHSGGGGGLRAAVSPAPAPAFSTMFRANQPSLPPSRSDKLLSALNQLFVKPSSSSKVNGSKKKQADVEQPVVEDPGINGENSPKPAFFGVEDFPLHSLDKPPKENLSPEEEKQWRKARRYQIWLQYHDKYPDIDINVAERLYEEGVSLKQFRSRQLEKRQSYLKKRKKHLEVLRQKNASYNGTYYISELIEKKKPIWLLELGNQELRGRLVKNQIYHFVIRPYEERRRKLHKLDVQVIAPSSIRRAFFENCYVEEAEASNLERPASNPKERFQLDEDTLKQSMEKEQKVYMRLHSGCWIEGRIAWFDPHQIGFNLDFESTDSEEENQVMILRHAINKFYKRRPSLWNSLLPYTEYRLQKKDDVDTDF